MTDRTPEQVGENNLWQTIVECVAYVRRSDPNATSSLLADEVFDRVIAALRAEGMLVEEGEVKVRLDGLEQRMAEVMAAEAARHDFGRLFDPAVWKDSARWWAAIAARVVRGETQEADRD